MRITFDFERGEWPLDRESARRYVWEDGRVQVVIGSPEVTLLDQKLIGLSSFTLDDVLRNAARALSEKGALAESGACTLEFAREQFNEDGA